MNRSATSIDLTGNKIGDAGADAIGTALRMNRSITSINLSYNNRIGDEGGRSIYTCDLLSLVDTMQCVWRRVILV